MSKDSSEVEEHPDYDIPKNLKSIDPNTGDYCVLSAKPESPVSEELRDENTSPDCGSKEEFKTTKLSEKKLYQNLDSDL